MKALNNMHNKRIIEIDMQLSGMLSEVLEIYWIETEKRWYKKETIHSLHWVILWKNNKYMDLPKIQFIDFEDFLRRWLIGLQDASNEHDHREKLYHAWSEQKLLTVDLLKYEKGERYIRLALERNFYREYVERVRYKPDDSLWGIWFWGNQMFWWLFISPVLRNSKWTNDVSEVRRAKFEYYTIWHILSTWLVNPDTNEVKHFSSFEEFIVFYKDVLRHISNSPYEKEIIDKYINFLKLSEDKNNELLLIPEFRYWGMDNNHLYRIDFTILNPHTRKMIWFEISPISSHSWVPSIKNTTQKAIVSAVWVQWEKEISKRNIFFDTYWISIITFTDKHLQDMDECFNEIKKYLTRNKQIPVNTDDIIKTLTGR